MERTELRDAFFAEVHRDPYAHMLAYLYADVWADAYEQAIRDAVEAVAAECSADEANVIASDGRRMSVPKELVDLGRRSHSDRRHDALEHLTEQQNLAAVRLAVALAQVGPLIPPRPPEGDAHV